MMCSSTTRKLGWDSLLILTDKLSETNLQDISVIVSNEGKPTEVLDMEAIEKMKEAFLRESNDEMKLSPENSTLGVHIYDGRSFRAFSW